MRACYSRPSTANAHLVMLTAGIPSPDQGWVGGWVSQFPGLLGWKSLGNVLDLVQLDCLYYAAHLQVSTN